MTFLANGFLFVGDREKLAGKNTRVGFREFHERNYSTRRSREQFPIEWAGGTNADIYS